MQEILVWLLGPEDPLEEGMATQSRILAWRIPWKEEPGGLQSMGSQQSWDQTQHEAHMSKTRWDRSALMRSVCKPCPVRMVHLIMTFWPCEARTHVSSSAFLLLLSSSHTHTSYHYFPTWRGLCIKSFYSTKHAEALSKAVRQPHVAPDAPYIWGHCPRCLQAWQHFKEWLQHIWSLAFQSGFQSLAEPSTSSLWCVPESKYLSALKLWTPVLLGHEEMDKSVPDQREGQRALPYLCKGRQLYPCAGGVSEEEIKWIRLSSLNSGLWTLTYSMLSGFMGQYFAIPFLVKTLVVISAWRVNCLYSVNVLSSISHEKKKILTN